MKKFLSFFLLLSTVALLLIDLNPKIDPSESYEEVLEGTVEKQASPNEEFPYLNIKITKGSLEGQEIELGMGGAPVLKNEMYELGEKVVVLKSETEKGEPIYSIIDRVRRPTLFWLFLLFVGVVAVISGRQGLESLLGMVFSFLVLFKLVFPLILNGHSPVWAAILGSLFIIPVTFYLSHGVKAKTTVAILGTLVTLLFTGLLAKLFANWGHLTGLTDDAASYLGSDASQPINFQGLLLAGILISMLGVLDDISISQASVAEELKGAKKSISFFELYKRTMNVGKDHIASMVNTLILVYAGASLPLMLLFIDRSHTFMEVLNYEFVAEEIIHTLVGSIGLILTVPITTAFACLHLRKEE